MEDSGAESGIESWDGAIGNNEGANEGVATENQADERVVVVPDLLGESGRLEQAQAVTLASQTNPGRL